MRITLTHTEPFNFDWEYNDIAEYYAIKVKDERYPRIVRAEQDYDQEDFLWLVDARNDEIFDKDSVDDIEAWEPISTLDFTIKKGNV